MVFDHLQDVGLHYEHFVPCYYIILHQNIKMILADDLSFLFKCTVECTQPQHASAMKWAFNNRGRLKVKEGQRKKKL